MSWFDDWVWLKVDSRRRAQNAIEEGFWAATFVAVTAAFFVLIDVMKDPDQYAIQGLLSVIVFGFIAFGIRRRSRAAALIALLLYVADRVFALISTGHGNLVLPVFITLAFLNAVRGTIAYHRLPPLPANLPSIEQSFQSIGNASVRNEKDKTSSAQ
jgi:hypothetical protein